MTLVLSLFPGIGLLDMAFEQEGFCVVRGPDLLWGGDIKRFHVPVGRFDGVIGGPPCQRFSRLSALVVANGYELAENLIPEYERVASEAQPAWFLMENVPAAPLPVVPGYLVRDLVVSNREDCGGEQSRVRRFSFGTRDGRALVLDWPAPPVPMVYRQAALASGSARAVPVALGGSGKLKRTRKGAAALGDKTEAVFADHVRAQGLPDGFDLPGFTVAGKVKAIGNGVPLPMGVAVARAVRRALATELARTEAA